MKTLIWYWDFYIIYFMYKEHKKNRYHRYMISKYGIKYISKVK